MLAPYSTFTIREICKTSVDGIVDAGSEKEWTSDIAIRRARVKGNFPSSFVITCLVCERAAAARTNAGPNRQGRIAVRLPSGSPSGAEIGTV